MAHFNPEELLKIASLSALKLNQAEIEAFASQLEVILSYTSELQAVSGGELAEIQVHSNVFREDKVHPGDAPAILAEAPAQKDGFFVVPKIL